jgi:hypothetical protein
VTATGFSSTLLSSILSSSYGCGVLIAFACAARSYSSAFLFASAISFALCAASSFAFLSFSSFSDSESTCESNLESYSLSLAFLASSSSLLSSMAC